MDGASGKTSEVEVLLVSMPFGQLLMPSIGLSLLKAGINESHRTKTLYFTFRFAELIGASFYSKIAGGAPANHDIVGEWIFSCGLFDQSELDVRRYIDDVLRGGVPGHSKSMNNQKLVTEEFLASLMEARTKVDAFLEECAEVVLEHNPRIVGFTSIFQQQIASLALAKRIKQRRPDIFVVLGGANCEAIMGAEVVRQFPFIDCVVSGEGDLVFPQLVQRVKEGKPVANLRGVLCRENLSLPPSNAPTVRDLNLLPIPDYHDYFEQLAASHLDLDERPRILFETSRGCWWGEKHHCTFCGLNGSTMAFRSKSSDRAMDELLHLTAEYPGYPVSVVDNILDMGYFKDFIPNLAASELDLELFYEVKANLKKEQVRALRDAGITQIQPGIESLSDDVLHLMRKGVKALQNIQLLKWCKELGVKAEWNILWGFPGEPASEYARMAELVPLLTHLLPPGCAAPIRLDRFSPNYDSSDELGFTNVVPYPAYNFVYPVHPEAVANLAYYFTFGYKEPQNVASYVRPLAEAIAQWSACHEESDLFYVDKGTHLLIWDLRPIAQEPLTVLTEYKRFAYKECDQARTARQLHEQITAKFGDAADLASIVDYLDLLVTRGLMIKGGGAYLSLAIPLGEYAPTSLVLQKLLATIDSLQAPSEAQDTQDTMVISAGRYMV
jgi:ribosomal peptide maturation radical SAM protein 1